MSEVYSSLRSISFLPTLDYSTQLFLHPLEACSYRQHRLLLSYRHKNLTYAPLFINSLASQVYGLSGSQTEAQGSGHRFQLRATGTSLQFEPTLETTSGEGEESSGMLLQIPLGVIWYSAAFEIDLLRCP